MHRIGLAFSGGGFRATLFHLGMIRFLREANILPAITHVTSVSGGSILAAHLVLNWQRYSGSLKEFDAAAAELIRFVQLDVRNRVLRRYPLAMPARLLRRLMLRRPCRQSTMTGLLEYHYEKYLYGDTCLFQLPPRPRLYILATNLSEGCLCAFSRDGLLMQRREPGQRFRFDRIHTGLATVPMAVTASSAFPGLFPPIELQGQDVGADPGLFGRLAFTDGGVYDNLGVRMFRCLERSWMAREISLQRDDLADADHAVETMQTADNATDDGPLHGLAQLLALPHNARPRLSASSEDEPVDRLLHGLWQVMSDENLARHPSFAGLTPPDADALPLLEAARRHGGEVDAGEQLWLNRQLIDAAFRAATGKPCFRSLNACFDGVLVSDAGKQFKISADTRAGGLVSTAMRRATDIAMDRVWQLEIDTFAGTPGFVFAPMSMVVEPSEDATALHPEVQRMAIDIRTDLDRFSPLEISALVQHGYCVGRSACRSRPDLFGANLPAEAPWDPFASGGSATTEVLRLPLPGKRRSGSRETSVAPFAENGEPPATSVNALTTATPPTPKANAALVPEPALETVASRKLQQSASRRLWSTLLDYRDWTSFIYVPLLVPLLFVLPYYGYKWYHRSVVAQQLIEGMAQGNRDYSVMSKLLLDGPSPSFAGIAAEEVTELPPLDYSGFEVIADSRVLDFRSWTATEGTANERSWAHLYRRVRVQKLKSTADWFVLHARVPMTRLDVRTLDNLIPTTVRLLRDKPDAKKPSHVFEIAFDLSKVHVGKVIDLPFEMMTREPRPVELNATTIFVDADTGMLSYWLMLPAGVQYRNFELLRVSGAEPGAPDLVTPASIVHSADGRILSFSLLSVKQGQKYECRWVHRD